MGFRMLRPAGVLLAVLLLAGCVPGEPVVTPEPDPDVTPVFASDEEALAAATEAYARYLEVSDQIAADGGADPDRIRPLVSADRLVVERQQYQALSESGNHQEGSATFDGVQLQQVSYEDGNSSVIVLYLCLDLSNTKLVDIEGHDITPSDIDLRTPFEVSLRGSSSSPLALIVERMERWSGSGVC